MAINNEPKVLLANLMFLQEKYTDASEQYSKILEEDPTNLVALIKRATCQANLGNWESVPADAITAREMDPRSVEAWKLCARAGLAGGDVDSALDCLNEALHIECNDQEACTILQSIVEDHLNKTIEGIQNKDFECVSWETQESIIPTLQKQFETGTESIEQKLLCHIQSWSSLNKLAENGNLPADQIEQTKSNAICILEIIGLYYNDQHAYPWALACHFLALYKSRHSSTNISNISTFNDEQIIGMINNIAKDWYNFNKTSKALEFFDSNVNLESVKPSKFLCTLLINLSCWLGDLDINDRQRLILERAIKIAEEQNYEFELSKAYISLGILYKSLGNIDCALSYLDKAEQKARLIGRREIISRSLELIVDCFCRRCQYEEALEKVEEARKVCPEPNISIYITLGMIYLNLSLKNFEAIPNDNFKMAKENFERGLKLAEECRSIGGTFACLSHLGFLHVALKTFDESIKYLDAAVSSAVTVGEKRFLFQTYGEHFLLKFMSVERGQDRCDLENAEKWLEKAEDCYNNMWDELKQDIDKIIWSDQHQFVHLNKRIQSVKWLADKKLETLIVAERFKARSFRDFIQMHQSSKTEQVLICRADDIKAVAYKLRHPIVFFSSTNAPDHFMCWIINPVINDIVSQMIHMHAEKEDAEHTYNNNNNIPLSEKNDRNVIIRALCESSENSQRKLYSTKKKINSAKIENYPFLFKYLWKCLEPHLNINNEIPNKVIVIPDDELWDVSFPLLLDENGIRLLHKYAISLAVSISSLKASKNFTHLREERNSALVIGNPEVSSKDEPCANLPMATLESNIVKGLLEAKIHGVKVDHFTGSTATKKNVLSVLSKAQLFHIASHASISTSSAVQLPGCLLLARDPSASTDESGMLTADEIQSLDLRGLRLAFLNCCYTGAGRVFAEGLVGLARAFLYAGAHEVVVSMRPVSDSQTTCDFVKKFYEEYLDNGEADIALNKAQKHMEMNKVDISEWGYFYVIRQKLCD